jgi:phosphoribosylformylglycinamidine synthase
VIGMVGLVESVAHAPRAFFESDGDAIVLLGEPTAELGASEYLARVHGVVAGAPPRCDLSRERATVDALLEAIADGVVSSAHDCSDGGLAVALAECAIGRRESPMGAEVDLGAWEALPLRALLFGEAQARIIVGSGEPDRVLEIAQRHGVPARRIGTVRAGSSSLVMRVGGREITASLERLASAYHDAIPTIMTRPALAAAEPPELAAAGRG